MQEIARQIKGKQKCRKKLPTWHQTPGIIYPSTLSLEQCSSELTGAYKAGLCTNASGSIADLTGGAGVDRSEEHTSELQSLMRISYAVFCLKKKRNILTSNNRCQKNKYI